MEYNIEDIEKKLNNCKNILNKEENKLKEIIIDTIEKDESNQNIDLLNYIMTEDEKHYFMINNAYKNYISQYSKEYIEMSEYYYGPELPYDVYCREFKKHDKESTFLDSGKDIKELYALFIFYAMFDYTLSESSAEKKYGDK